MKRNPRIVYAAELSTATRRVFTQALALTKALDGRLTIVHVMATVLPAIPPQQLDAVTLDQLDRQARDWSTRQLEGLRARAKKAGVTASSELRTGDPSSEIIRAARKSGADLIVVGTHARRGLKKFLLGSVAEKVIAAAPCPVVTVRAT